MSGQFETSPHFTVIIPCKDRADYLAHTLRTCMMQSYEPLEIIVSDDGSTDSTRAVVEDAARKDPRIRFIAHDSPIGMRDNFEFALQEAKPGFVIMLGSDDGLLPDGITGMRDVLRDTGTDLLAWSAAIFTYPGVRGANGQLAIYNRKGTRLVESSTFLERQSRNLHYLSDLESPMLYVKGVASTRLIDRVRGRSPDRRFYACATPDGYSGIVLAGEVERYAFSGRPFSLYGLSPSSQGLAYLSNAPEAKKVSAAFYKSAEAVPLHRELSSLPYSPLISLMTADYLLRARDLKGWPGRFPQIDYRRMLTKSIAELSHGLYAGERICRELAILNRIADQHGLGDFFRETVRGARRRRPKAPFTGSGVSTKAFFLDAATFRIRDIFDAAYAAHNYYELIANGRRESILAAFSNSVRYRFASLARGAPFPQEAEWISTDPAGV